MRRIFAGIAQLVEQLICNQQVVGSNPTAGSIVKRDSGTKAVIMLDHFWTTYSEHHQNGPRRAAMPSISAFQVPDGSKK
jgi:hypothetical protein